jgi:hypothetical protein
MNTLVSIIENACRTAPEKGIVHVAHGKDDYFQSFDELYSKSKATAFILRSKGLKSGNILILSVENHIFYPTVLGVYSCRDYSRTHAVNSGATKNIGCFQTANGSDELSECSIGGISRRQFAGQFPLSFYC